MGRIGILREKGGCEPGRVRPPVAALLAAPQCIPEGYLASNRAATGGPHLTNLGPPAHLLRMLPTFDRYTQF